MTSYETERWSYALTHPSAIPIITNTRQAPFFSVLLFQCLSPLENWPITPPPRHPLPQDPDSHRRTSTQL